MYGKRAGERRGGVRGTRVLGRTKCSVNDTNRDFEYIVSRGPGGTNVVLRNRRGKPELRSGLRRTKARSVRGIGGGLCEWGE